MKSVRFFCLVIGFLWLPNLMAQDTLTAYERERLRLYKLQHEMLELRLEMLEQRLVRNMESEDGNQAGAIESLSEWILDLQDSIYRLGAMVEMMADELYVVEAEEETNSFVSSWPFPDYVYALHPVGLFQGMFEMSIERVIADSWSLEFSMKGTYLTRSGFGSNFLKEQDFTYYDQLLQSYMPYSGEMVTGFGFGLRAKHFPMHRIDSVHHRAPLGIYAAPVIQYRYYDILGERERWVNGIWVTDDVVRHLNSMGFGLHVGYQFPLFQVLAVDIYAGGLIRLSRYTNEPHFTRFRKWNNIDYSGVMPTAGVRIGMIR